MTTMLSFFFDLSQEKSFNVKFPRSIQRAHLNLSSGTAIIHTPLKTHRLNCVVDEMGNLKFPATCIKQITEMLGIHKGGFLQITCPRVGIFIARPFSSGGLEFLPTTFGFETLPTGDMVSELKTSKGNFIVRITFYGDNGLMFAGDLWKNFYDYHSLHAAVGAVFEYRGSATFKVKFYVGDGTEMFDNSFAPPTIPQVTAALPRLNKDGNVSGFFEASFTVKINRHTLNSGSLKIPDLVAHQAGLTRKQVANVRRGDKVYCMKLVSSVLSAKDKSKETGPSHINILGDWNSFSKKNPRTFGKSVCFIIDTDTALNSSAHVDFVAIILDD